MKNSFQESRLVYQRVLVAAFLIVLGIAGLVLRLVYLQIVGYEHYASLSHENRVKISPLPPLRGLIYDRNGEVLAENITIYSLEIMPEQVTDLPNMLAKLKELLNLTPEELHRFEQMLKRRKRFENIPLRMQLSEEEIARFAVRMPYFPGAEIRPRFIRTYPYGTLAAHVVGYVGRISEADMQELDPSVYSGTYHIGKIGIEKYYEDLLHGKTGHEEIETNAQGRAVNVLDSTQPLPGADLHLSLDIRLQKVALDAMEEYMGAVVALEPATGRILAFVSKPGFDPNPFVYGIPNRDYQVLQKAPDQPLYNRALRGMYPPGSTIKPIVGLAGLEYGVINAGTREFCPGYYRLPNVEHRYRDWKKYGHGSVDLRGAITESCDVYFYDLAHVLGIDRLHTFLHAFGFGEKTGVDLSSEKGGTLPSREWKQKKRKKPWFPGETLITGIGQGYMQVTPIQLAKAVAIVANRGLVIIPHLLDWLQTPFKSGPPERSFAPTTRLDVRSDHWTAVANAMIDVVHSARGTAKAIGRGAPYLIAGKTGTAQVFTVGQKEDYKSMRVKEELRDHALFVAFAPAPEPRIAIAVIAEHGGHGGSVAAPIARKVMDAYLNDGNLP